MIKVGYWKKRDRGGKALIIKLYNSECSILFRWENVFAGWSKRLQLWRLEVWLFAFLKKYY